jgi:hypothetical protein
VDLKPYVTARTPAEEPLVVNGGGRVVMTRRPALDLRTAALTASTDENSDSDSLLDKPAFLRRQEA